MGIDYMFVNLDKKQYIKVSRWFEDDSKSLDVLYLMKYEWRGDKVVCVGDPESLWDVAYDEYEQITVERKI